jgi:uncharacterized repeat protein (TIGR01451 family)
MVYGAGEGMKMRKLVGVILALGLLVPWGKAEALVKNTKLTNFVSGIFSLASKITSDATITGKSPFGLYNSASAWVIVTDEAQQCMQVWKVADKRDWVPITTASAGELVCFTISYSNCGTSTALSMALTDRTPVDSGWSLMPWMSTPGTPWSQFNVRFSYDDGLTWIDEQPPQNYPGSILVRWRFTNPTGIGIGVSGYINYCVTVL